MDVTDVQDEWCFSFVLLFYSDIREITESEYLGFRDERASHPQWTNDIDVTASSINDSDCFHRTKLFFDILYPLFQTGLFQNERFYAGELIKQLGGFQ